MYLLTPVRRHTAAFWTKRTTVVQSRGVEGMNKFLQVFRRKIRLCNFTELIKTGLHNSENLLL